MQFRLLPSGGSTAPGSAAGALPAGRRARAASLRPGSPGAGATDVPRQCLRRRGAPSPGAAPRARRTAAHAAPLGLCFPPAWARLSRAPGHPTGVPDLRPRRQTPARGGECGWGLPLPRLQETSWAIKRRRSPFHGQDQAHPWEPPPATCVPRPGAEQQRAGVIPVRVTPHPLAQSPGESRCAQGAGGGGSHSRSASTRGQRVPQPWGEGLGSWSGRFWKGALPGPRSPCRPCSRRSCPAARGDARRTPRAPAGTGGAPASHRAAPGRRSDGGGDVRNQPHV